MCNSFVSVCLFWKVTDDSQSFRSSWSQVFFQVFNFSGIERGIFSRNVFSRRNAEIRDKVVKDENFKPEV